MVPLPTLRVPTPKTANPYLANPSRRKPLWLPLPFSAVSQRETKRNTEAIWGGSLNKRRQKKKHSFLKLVQTGSYGLVWLEHLLVWSASSLGWTPPRVWGPRATGSWSETPQSFGWTSHSAPTSPKSEAHSPQGQGSGTFSMCMPQQQGAQHREAKAKNHTATTPGLVDGCGFWSRLWMGWDFGWLGFGWISLDESGGRRGFFVWVWSRLWMAGSWGGLGLDGFE